VARANGRTVELAVQRALAELDFAPGELSEDQYEVTIIIPPEEGFMGVGGVDAVVEVALVGEDWERLEDDLEPVPPELLKSEQDRYAEDDLAEEWQEAGDDLGPLLEGESLTPDGLRLRRFLERVLDELGLNARVRITEHEQELRAEVIGEDLGIFIGRRGQTMDAIEYLAGVSLSAASSGRKRVELDAEGYKDRRRRQIERLALRKADEAVKRGRAVQLAPMTAAERKIVHLSLRSRTDVSTVSQGREPNRSVIITPVKGGGRS
jgi:spoIIIJ-associated protein